MSENPGVSADHRVNQHRIVLGEHGAHAELDRPRAAVQILGRRLTASVLLVQALGGGWHDTELSSARDVTRASR